jgi:hypothetical protein
VLDPDPVTELGGTAVLARAEAQRAAQPIVARERDREVVARAEVALDAPVAIVIEELVERTRTLPDEPVEDRPTVVHELVGRGRVSHRERTQAAALAGEP